MNRSLRILVAVSLVTMPTVSAAQDLRFLTCGEVRFGGTSCLTPLPPPEEARPVQAEPLFPPSSVARDAPPLLLRLAEEPTLAHAKQFLAWQRRRQARLQEVQRLLKEAAETEATP
jgi:hypothetical protein